MKRKSILFIMVLMLLSFSIIGYSSVNVERIEAFIAYDMGFRVDGEAWQPVDTDGTLLYPLIYRGRSYVPVRALLEEQGVWVDFENETRTIILDYEESRIGKYIDKATPVLFSKMPDFLDPDDDGDTILTVFEIEPQKMLENYPFVIDFEMEMPVNKEATVTFNGKPISIEELARGNDRPSESLSLNFGKIEVTYSNETGDIIDIVIEEGQEMRASGDRPKFEIEVSGPPFKIKLIIKF